MKETLVWWLQFLILSIGFLGCSTVSLADVLLNEIIEFSRKEFLENSSGDFQIPEILSSNESAEYAKNDPAALSKIREVSKSEGRNLLAEHVKSRYFDRDVIELFKTQLTDPDFRQLVELKGADGERFSEDAKRTIIFLLLSLNQAWSEEEVVRAEVRRRVARKLREQNLHFPDVRPTP